MILSHTHARARVYVHVHTRMQTGGGTLLGTLGRCARTVLRPGFDHIFASAAAALRPITVNKNPCLHVVNLIIFLSPYHHHSIARYLPRRIPCLPRFSSTDTPYAWAQDTVQFRSGKYCRSVTRSNAVKSNFL